MIVCIRKEICFRFVEERCLSTVLFGQDNFVKDLDRRVISPLGLSCVNELVEGYITLVLADSLREERHTLSLLHHCHVRDVIIRHALHEFLHFELVDQTGLLLVP